ncbi:MAG: hypothetical protein WAM14_00265 [Candidatus Nitrosopolaris sp.]
MKIADTTSTTTDTRTAEHKKERKVHSSYFFYFFKALLLLEDLLSVHYYDNNRMKQYHHTNITPKKSFDETPFIYGDDWFGPRYLEVKALGFVNDFTVTKYYGKQQMGEHDAFM